MKKVVLTAYSNLCYLSTNCTFLTFDMGKMTVSWLIDLVVRGNETLLPVPSFLPSQNKLVEQTLSCSYIVIEFCQKTINILCQKLHD